MFMLRPRGHSLGYARQGGKLDLEQKIDAVSEPLLGMAIGATVQEFRVSTSSYSYLSVSTQCIGSGGSWDGG